MEEKKYSIEIGGKTLTAIFTDLVEQAHGSVMLKYGETIVLATVCMSKDPQENLGYFNLTVDYIEKSYAAGKILGSRFNKKEGKPSEEAILAGRIIDRTIRPLFNHRLRHAVQVIVTVLSVDDNDPVVLAVNAASLALCCSNIPWNGPVGAVRIGKYADKNFKINAEHSLRDEDSNGNINYAFDLFVCGINTSSGSTINMIEASALQISESEIEEALKAASVEIGKLEDFQKKIIKEINSAKRVIETEEVNSESVKLYNEKIAPGIRDAIFSGPGKKKIDELHTIWNQAVKEKYPDRKDVCPEDDLFDENVNKILHEGAILENKRADGRKMDELRGVYVKAGGFSSMLHGSGIFYRGGTRIFSALALGGPDDRNLIDGLQIKMEKRFMHHYNFPPYSVGEVGRIGFTNRREVGHAALVEKALLMVLPGLNEFPYTIRLVSEAMSSNGSTSQGSVCASTLALMDGGVPIKAPVAGIAMGLMYENDSKYKILTDIQGPEDHYGDMDFKIAGTEKGITAIQLDVKVEGVPIKILREAMDQAKQARLKILEKIKAEIPAPRVNISPNAPEILILKINIDKIGLVIGSGGKTIKDISSKTGAVVTIEDDGTVYLTGKSGSAKEAKDIIEKMTYEWKVGDIAEGRVVKVLEVGAVVKLTEWSDGFVHISEIAPFRVDRVDNYIREGMVVPVKVIKIDTEKDRINLSIVAANPNFFRHNK